MKKTTLIIGLIALIFFVLASCSDGYAGGDTATIKINLGQGSVPGKAVASTDQLKHVLTFSGPTGTKTVTVLGGGTASVTVVAGLWQITVQAYLGEELYAIGDATVEVKAGKNTDVSIQMTVVWNGGGEGVGVVRGNRGDGIVSIAIGFEGGTDPALGFNDALGSYTGLELSYELELIDSSGNQEDVPVDAVTGKASKQVSPGNYNITVKAKLNGWDYATGTAPVFAVSTGETKNVSITMQRLTDAIVLSVKKDELIDFGSGLSSLTTTPEIITIYNFSNTPISITANISGASVFGSVSPLPPLPSDNDTPITINPGTISSTGVHEGSLTIAGGSFNGVVDLLAIVYSLSISNQDELNAIRGNLSGNYTLANDITLVGNWTPIGSYSSGDYTNVFSGNFDGDGYTIYDLTITSSGPGGHGLFAYIASGGVVKNLKLDNVNISSIYTVNDFVGAIAGGNAAGTVENCYVAGTVQGYDYVGAIVGRNLGTVQNCYSEGSVSGNYAVGGIAGMNDLADTVKNCYSLATVSGNNLVGGIVGNYYVGNIENCVALNASVTGNSGVGRITGGTSGGPPPTFSNNYARTGMTVTIGVNPTTPSGTTSDINGANVDPGTTSGQYNDQNFWDSLGWDFTPITGIWGMISGYPELQ